VLSGGGEDELHERLCDVRRIGDGPRVARQLGVGGPDHRRGEGAVSVEVIPSALAGREELELIDRPALL
jgi:hypothetical protein